MYWVNLGLIFVAVLYVNIIMMIISFVFAYILLRRQKGNPIYFNFGMSDLFLGLWMLVTLADFFRLTPLSTNFHARLGFIMGVWILHYFLIFTFYFPFKRAINKFVIPLLYIGTVVISIITLLPSFIASASVDFPFRYREVNPVSLSIYIFYFFVLALFSLVNLFRSFESGDGIHKVNAKKVLAGTSIAIGANLILSLINFYYTSFDLTSLGMLFTFTVLIYIYSILFSKKVY